MAQKITHALDPANVARIRARKGQMMQAAPAKRVTMDDALAALLDEAESRGLSPANTARIQGHRDYLTAMWRREVSVDEAVENLIDMAEAYATLQQVPVIGQEMRSP